MIRPTKHLNLDNSLINISVLLITEFTKQKVISYDDLLLFSQNKIGVQAKEVVPYALNFLFLLGKIKYHKAIDAFELLDYETK